MEQIKKFLRDRGFALALLACLVAAGAAGVWAVRAVRDELEKSYGGLVPDASSTRQTDRMDTEPNREGEAWQDLTEAANSVGGVPKTDSSSGLAGASSGAQSGAGSLREPSELQGSSAAASSSEAPVSGQPVEGRILNAFSGDELVYNKTLGDWRTHNGVDYACTQGAAVAAPVAGKVVSAGAEGNWGTVVVLQDAQGRSWRLCGVADPAVKAGETVAAGQKLGTVGTVGCECAEESHIHVEVKQGEAYLDPAKLSE
mgnify:FL=1